MPDITCYDGSLAPSYDQCPDIGAAWEPATGIGIDPTTGELGEGVFGDDWVAPAWWDDPGTTDPGEDEWATYIYQKSGGEQKTGMLFEDFWTTYGPEGENLFPTWEESGYAAKYENVLEQLGMLNTSIRLASEKFNLDLDSLGLQKHAKIETALTQKEDIGKQMESQFIGTGGLVSGRRMEAAEAISEDVTQALGLEFRGIDIDRDLLEIGYEGELVNIEDRKIDYETELINIEDSYERHLLDLVSMIDIQKVDCEDGETLCSDGQTCVTDTAECPDISTIPSNGKDDPLTIKDELDITNKEITLGQDCFYDSTGNWQCIDPLSTTDDEWIEEGEAGFDAQMNSACQEQGANWSWDPAKSDCVESAGEYENRDLDVYINPGDCGPGLMPTGEGGCVGVTPEGSFYCQGFACMAAMETLKLAGVNPAEWWDSLTSINYSEMVTSGTLDLASGTAEAMDCWIFGNCGGAGTIPLQPGDKETPIGFCSEGCPSGQVQCSDCICVDNADDCNGDYPNPFN